VWTSMNSAMGGFLSIPYRLTADREALLGQAKRSGV
jgi:hypothetical protein